MRDTTSDAYADYMRDKLRDERIEQSQELIQECKTCALTGITAYYSTDMKHFSDRKKAIEHQYQLLRKIK